MSRGELGVAGVSYVGREWEDLGASVWGGGGIRAERRKERVDPVAMTMLDFISSL